MSQLLGRGSLNLAKAHRLFRDDKCNLDDPSQLAMRAWVVQTTALACDIHHMADLTRLDTRHMDKQLLAALSKLVRHAYRLEALKPLVAKNDVKSEYKMKKGELHVESTRFKTRLQRTRTQFIKVQTTHKGKDMSYVGSANRVKGRTGLINLNRTVVGDNLSITTIGKDPLTSAQKLRQEVVSLAFHGKTSLKTLPFFSTIWSQATVSSVSAPLPPLPPAPSICYSGPLNGSQEMAVHSIVSPAIRATKADGPPGSGKTTVIAAAVNSMSCADPERGIWLLAQSNVAVKNIAEKLAQTGFLKFRLIVSENFHFQWHEHLYESIENNVIRSDQLPETLTDLEEKLLDTKVILCTLSMISSPLMSLIPKFAPVQTVIIDEASQIEMGDYIPLLHEFRKTLAKLVFIGDDKQLAPYGQEEIPDLESIFEVPNLRADKVFLDTSYRMPTFICNFISRHVYDGRLKSKHNLHSKSACRFVDVDKGQEEKSGHSWIVRIFDVLVHRMGLKDGADAQNKEEVHMVMRIARKFLNEGKSFRIITGYDAQRTALENTMKSEGLNWEDKCFNVDSFQDDYIIISVVRTKNLGFLSNQRRSNVMLSRCKRGMIICSNKSFLYGPGSSSLIGKLAEECGAETWLTRQHILNGNWRMPC
ncbi:P-loop containing nucleoside triphosphate hydrolase protein [Dentipellis sp. KUC8613]|nr:P-loop containing nucleoside triphosphate hydrolase protein [Dentipellis sp. KUC8613]